MTRSFSVCLMQFGAVAALFMLPLLAHAHPGHEGHHHHDNEDEVQVAHNTEASLLPLSAVRAAAEDKVSGQGTLKFRVLYTGAHLPQGAIDVLVKAHGGFAVDRRDGHGETYFALPGAGIIRMSADLKTTELIETPAEVRDTNMHNTTIWYDQEGAAFLAFPANDAGKVFTTTLDGKLVNTLETPKPEELFNEPTVDGYFAKGGKFVPTDVEQLNGLYYVTTGYSDLDYVLTARIQSTNPFAAHWQNLAFGGKGTASGQFGTGHGITVSPDEKRIDVADRPNSEIDRFSPEGKYQDTVTLPAGSFPCDVDFVGPYTVVGCLHGPNHDLGAPVYIMENDQLVSTILPKEELGLQNFQHIHNATGVMLGGKLYIIAQAWNPGDFAVFEQVTP
ncbi:MAG: hypothetical protein IT365_08200 [Candidatus Hydrogenedentes bacterium]|nr:hypothetical protein [Candidatus Hydrogenedentota bacterium]